MPTDEMKERIEEMDDLPRLPNPRHAWCGGTRTEFVRNASGKWMVFRCLDCAHDLNGGEFEIDGE